MVATTGEGIDLFKIANRSISGWVPSFKMGTVAPVKHPFCSQLEERLLLWLDYYPLVASYVRGDIGPQFAMTYRLQIPKHAPFAIGYTFEGKPHEYLSDVVVTLPHDKPFIAEVGMEDDKRGDRNLAKAEAARRLAHLQGGVFWIGTERTLTRAHHYNLVFLHARCKTFPAYAEMVLAVQEVWPAGEVASVEEVSSRLTGRWPKNLVEAAIWKLVGDSLAAGHLLVDLKQPTLDRELLLVLLPPDAPPLVPDRLPETLEAVPDAMSRLPTISSAPRVPVPGPTFDASTLDEAQRDRFHRNLRAVEQVLPGTSQTRVAKESGIDRSTISRLVKRIRELGQIACVPHGRYHCAPQPGEEDAIPTTASIKCTFLGVVPIDIKRFEESGVLVKCPDCGRTWTLSPGSGVVRFKSHDKRKTTTSTIAERWGMRETIWNVVGGENK